MQTTIKTFTLPMTRVNGRPFYNALVIRNGKSTLYTGLISLDQARKAIAIDALKFTPDMKKPVSGVDEDKVFAVKPITKTRKELTALDGDTFKGETLVMIGASSLMQNMISYFCSMHRVNLSVQLRVGESPKTVEEVKYEQFMSDELVELLESDEPLLNPVGDTAPVEVVEPVEDSTPVEVVESPAVEEAPVEVIDTNKKRGGIVDQTANVPVFDEAIEGELVAELGIGDVFPRIYQGTKHFLQVVVLITSEEGETSSNRADVFAGFFEDNACSGLITSSHYSAATPVAFKVADGYASVGLILDGVFTVMNQGIDVTTVKGWKKALRSARAVGRLYRDEKFHGRNVELATA